MEALSKAEEEMRNSASHADSGAQQRAANQLGQAQSAIKNMLSQQASNGLGDLASKAKQLSASQADLARRIKKQYGADAVNVARTDENGTPEMPEMNGPGYGGFRRRQQQQTTDPQNGTAEEKSLAEENDKLAAQVQDLQNQLQEQAQSLTASQPDTTRKIRKALSDAEQEEIAVRMRKSSDWLRQGFGSRTWPVEDSITAATQHLSKQIDEARQTSEKAQSAAPGNEEGSLGQALAEVRQLREQLQAQSQQGRSQGGQQSSQSGKAGASQSQGQGEGNQSSPTGMAGGRFGQQSAVDQLTGVRTQIGRDDRQLNNYLDNAMGAVRHLDGESGLLDARLSGNAMLSLERLEMELARRMGQKVGARTNTQENVPEGYRDAVATYFRTLSK